MELSTRFINLPPAEVDLEIEAALQRVCESLGIDDAVLWQWTAADPVLILPTHAHPPLASPRTSEPLRQGSFPWVVQEMRAGRSVVVCRLDDLPEEARVDRESARLTGILSNLTLSLSVGGAPPVGALAFNTRRVPRDWTKADVDRLRLVAQVFATALARRRDDEAHSVGEARLEAAADLAGLAFYELDYANGTSYLDDRFKALLGLPQERASGLAPFEFWVEHLHPDDRSSIMEARRELHDGTREQLMLEYRYEHPDRGQIWLHHVARAAARDASGRATRTAGVCSDITERKRAEEALRRSLAEVERLKDRLQAETDYLRGRDPGRQAQDEITGKSPAMLTVLRQVEQVAATDSTVLVRGETGTGKELIARAIHRMSPRRQVMVKVNCGALPSGLVESELFGREKGAFTGALSRQVGRFEVADGSTLFLDEVGELPPEVQVKLLRVLQEGEFERLGSPRTIKVNVRVIAATNRDLLEEVRKGRFREDLYYRLNVFPLRVPPLRERTEDIPLLVWTISRGILLAHGQEDHPGPAQDDGRPHAAPVARERPRAAQRDRTRRHSHDRGDAEVPRLGDDSPAGGPAADARRRRTPSHPPDARHHRLARSRGPTAPPRAWPQPGHPLQPDEEARDQVPPRRRRRPRVVATGTKPRRTAFQTPGRHVGRLGVGVAGMNRRLPSDCLKSIACPVA